MYAEYVSAYRIYCFSFLKYRAASFRKGKPLVIRKKRNTRENRPGKSRYNPFVPAVEQASKVLICLARNGRFKMNLTDICNQVGIHKSKGHSILNTLMKYGFIEKDRESKAYSLGPGLLFLSRKVLDHLDIRSVITPYLEELAAGTLTTGLLGLISADQVFVVAKHEGNKNIGVTIRLGHRFHITAGAHGKAIVAFLSEDERRRILSKKRLFFYGDPKKMDHNRLRDELKDCRKRGFSSDIGGLQTGINAVSSPVFGPGKKVIGCLILMGTFEESLAEQYGIRLAKTVEEISGVLGATDGPVFDDLTVYDFV